MKTLTQEQTKQVSGGLFFDLVIWLTQEALSAAFLDILKGRMQPLGERENRGLGTRP